MAAQKPWWTFPRIDAFGTTDPQGNYWKPDSNIQIPGNYPVTALLPGVITSIQNTNYGQTVITEHLDNPINQLAQYNFYEHMSSATVREGQHVSTGDLLGYNNPAGAVPLGFGLYSGPMYGFGDAWNTLQADLAPGGQGLLNPTQLLDNAKSGSGFGFLGNIGGLAQKVPTNLSPNANVSQTLVALDNLGQITNPFDTSQNNVQSVAGVDNPISWLGAVGTNFVGDTRAMAFRFVLLVLGAVLVYKSLSQFVDIGSITNAAARFGELAALG